jgi:glycosyltransferase involved in cell wall biosynthesis
MKILCLISWVPRGRWIFDYVPGNTDQIDFVYIKPPIDRFPGYGKLMGYYQKFWWLGYNAYRKMKDYDLVIAWEANTGLPLAFMRTLFGQNRPPLVILNFVLKGKPILDTLWLTRFALRSVNHITCVSYQEIEYYSKLLNFPASQCDRIQGPWYAHPYEEQTESTGEYIFSAGRSHRDYGTLFRAVSNSQIPVIVNARDFNVKGLDKPSNVTINPFLPYQDFVPLVEQAKLIVLPLYEAKHASGETFLVQTLAAGKPVVVTRTYSTEEIIVDGVNGLLVPPGDVGAMQTAIKFLLDHPEKAKAIGKRARIDYLEKWAFPVVAHQLVQLLHRIVYN